MLLGMRYAHLEGMHSVRTLLCLSMFSSMHASICTFGFRTWEARVSDDAHARASDVHAPGHGMHLFGRHTLLGTNFSGPKSVLLGACP